MLTDGTNAISLSPGQRCITPRGIGTVISASTGYTNIYVCEHDGVERWYALENLRFEELNFVEVWEEGRSNPKPTQPEPTQAKFTKGHSYLAENDFHTTYGINKVSHGNCIEVYGDEALRDRILAFLQKDTETTTMEPKPAQSVLDLVYDGTFATWLVSHIASHPAVKDIEFQDGIMVILLHDGNMLDMTEPRRRD